MLTHSAAEIRYIRDINDGVNTQIGLNLLVLKTEDIHPPKTGISVHFSGSLV